MRIGRLVSSMVLGCLMGACTGMMGGALLIGSSGADSGEYMLGAAAIWISLLGSGLERCEKWLTVCLFICLVVCSFVWLFICFSVCLFVHLFVVVVVVVVTSRSSARSRYQHTHHHHQGVALRLSHLTNIK